MIGNENTTPLPSDADTDAAADDQFQRLDGKSYRFTCQFCGTSWVERYYGQDIFCTRCFPFTIDQDGPNG